MKKTIVSSFLILFLLISSSLSFAFQEDITTIIFVRHAEKEQQELDPPLTKEGEKRAEDLAYFLKNVSLDGIYATPYQRTRKTAQPVAKEKNLEITIRNTINLEGIQQLVEEVINNYSGKTVLIVNHSHLIHAMIKLVKKEDVDLRTAERIDERIYDDIFIVTYSKRENARVLRLKYGKHSRIN